MWRGEGEQVNVHGPHVNGEVPDGLHRIGMESTPRSRQIAPISVMGCDRADFVVGVHHGDEDGLVRDRPADVFRVHQPVLIHRQIGELHPALFQHLRGVEHRVMLDLRGDDVIALLLLRDGRSDERLIIGFRAGAGEDDLCRERAQQGGELLAGEVYAGAGLLPGKVQAGGVAPFLSIIRQHRLDHLRARGGCRGVVEIGHFHSGSPVDNVRGLEFRG